MAWMAPKRLLNPWSWMRGTEERDRLRLDLGREFFGRVGAGLDDHSFVCGALGMRS